MSALKIVRWGRWTLTFYLLQWIEIEYRAMQLLKDNKWQKRVFFIEVEKDLKDYSTMSRMLKFFDLESISKELEMNLNINKTPFTGKTHLIVSDIKECQQLIKRLPQQYKDLLMQPPYMHCKWISKLNI